MNITITIFNIFNIHLDAQNSTSFTYKCIISTVINLINDRCHCDEEQDKSLMIQSSQLQQPMLILPSELEFKTQT